MKTASLVVIRCVTPDSEWCFPVADLGEVAFKVCYSDFIEHCIHIHGLKADTASDALVFLDPVKWTLTLLK